jgi:ferredoxin
LGRVGIHRNVIHPRFGNFILLGTILVGAEISAYSQELDYNPCLECKLCVAACPVGAIGVDGAFNFSSCYTHNYREFMGGFGDWVETVADSKNSLDYRRRVKEFGISFDVAKPCLRSELQGRVLHGGVPAGEDVIGPYLASKKDFADDVMRPLQAKREPVYVVRGSDAEAHVRKRYPHKSVRPVRGLLRPRSIAGLLFGMRVSFQRHAAGKLDVTYHFVFTGNEQAEATVTIRNGKITVENGLLGPSNIKVIADSETWLGFLAGERNLLWALITRRVRLQGHAKWLLGLKRCFPS